MQMMQAAVRAIAATWPIAAAMLGVVLPLSFLQDLDGLLSDRSFPEILQIYGTAAMLNVAVAIVAGIAVLLIAAPLSALLVRATAGVAASLSTWLARLLVAAALVRAAHGWLYNFGLLGAGSIYLRIGVALALIAICIVWTQRQPRPGPLFVRLAGGAAAVSVASMLLLPLGSAGAHSGAQPGTIAAAKPPVSNVLLITLDALSAQHMSLYGYGRPTTPRIDQFARAAVVFDRFYSNDNWTQSGVASILSGRRPWSTFSDNYEAGPEAAAMSRNLLRLAQESGYTTLSVVTNGLAGPVHQKTARWLDDGRLRLRTLNESVPYWGERHGLLPEAFDQGVTSLLVQTDFIPWFAAEWHGGARNFRFDPAAAVRAAEAVWNAHAGAPRFLWLHIIQPHGPYAVPPPFLGRFDPQAGFDSYFTSSPPAQFYARGHAELLSRLSARYDEAVNCADFHVGELLDWLERRGELESTLVIISADHGESFRHEYGSHQGPRLYEELIHVPLVIKLPHQSQGRREALVAEQVDLLPTVAALLGRDPGATAAEGKVLPVVDGAPAAAPVPAYSMNLNENRRFGPLTTGTVAVIDGDYKYVHYFGPLHYPEMPPLHDQLFNVVQDPGEEHDLVDLEPARAAAMKAQIEAEIVRQNRGVRARHGAG